MDNMALYYKILFKFELILLYPTLTFRFCKLKYQNNNNLKSNIPKLCICLIQVIHEYLHEFSYCKIIIVNLLFNIWLLILADFF